MYTQECDELVAKVHSAGAGVLFFAGTVYTIFDSVLTLLLARQRDGDVTYGESVRWYGWLRPVLSVIAFGNMILGKFTIIVIRSAGFCIASCDKERLISSLYT